MSPPLKSALGCTTTDEVHIFVFPDGRECVPAAVVERSSLLKGLLGESGDAIVKLPRAVFQLWAVCSKDCDPSLSTAALVQMIKTADFLADEAALARIAAALAAQLLGKNEGAGEISQEAATEQSEAASQEQGKKKKKKKKNPANNILNQLTTDQGLRVLRAATTSLHVLLTKLPPKHRGLAFLALNPTLETSHSLTIKLSDPLTTSLAAECLSSLTAITGLAFRPWMDDQATTDAFHTIQTLSSIKSLNLAGMHLTAHACTAFREALSGTHQLRSLGLSDCGITESKLQILLPALCAVPNLNQLSLRDNHLFLEGAVLLGNHFKRFKRLKKLDLYNIQLARCVDHAAFKRLIEPSMPPKPFVSIHFAHLLGNLTALQTLDVRSNDLGGMHQRIFGMSLAHLKHFTRLNTDAPWPIEFAGQVPDFILAHEAREPGGDCSMLRAESGLQHTLALTSRDQPFMYDLYLDISTSPPANYPPNLYEITHNRKSLHTTSLTQLHSAQHVTALHLNIKQLYSQAPALAKELAAMTQLLNLSLSCEQKRDPGGEAIAFPDSALLPFAKHLSSFVCLTSLSWTHHPRMQSTHPEYAENLAGSLLQLQSLKRCWLKVGELDDHSSQVLGEAFSSLSSLTHVGLGYTTEALMSTLTPLLPSSTLRELSVLGGVEQKVGGEGMWTVLDCLPALRAFTDSASHLIKLEELDIKAKNVASTDVNALSALLARLTALTKIDLHLLEHEEDRAEPHNLACSDASLAGLWRSLRALPHTKKLSTLLGHYPASTASDLFVPEDAGLSPYACWRSLIVFTMGMTLSPLMGLIPNGDVVLQALCAAERLEELNLGVMEFTEASIAPLWLQTEFPCLRILHLMFIASVDTAALLGHALSQISMPCLEDLLIECLPGSSITAIQEDEGGYMGGGEYSEDPDALMRCIMQGFEEVGLPSLQKLTLVATRGRREIVKIDDVQARSFGAALSAILRGSLRLQTLNVHSLDMSSECLKMLAPCIGTLNALTSVQLGAAHVSLAASETLLQHAKGRSTLCKLRLLGCAIEDRAVGPLVMWLEGLPELRELDFIGCQMGPAGSGLIGRLRQTLSMVDDITWDCRMNRNLA